MNERLPVAVLVSGTGTNLQALLDTVHGREAQVVAVASSVAGAPALARATAAGVPTAVFDRADYPDRATRDDALATGWASAARGWSCWPATWSCSASRSSSASPGLSSTCTRPCCPPFPGCGAIEQALEYGVKVFGVTVHFVDAGVDSGPVILQAAVELPDAREPDEVLAALRPLEHELLPRAVALFARNALRVDPENPRRTIVDRL